MNIHQIHNLNLELQDLKVIKQIIWDSRSSKFSFSCNFGKIKKIEMIDDSILYIKFENGDIRLDLDKNELSKIK